MNKRIKKKFQPPKPKEHIQLSEYQKKCYYCTPRGFCIYGLDSGVATSRICPKSSGRGCKYYFSNYLYEKSRGDFSG